jgi:hypothetical protein
MSQIEIQNNQTEENILTTKNNNNNLNLVENKIELKSVEFMLTPLETLLINKKMPFGIKLDTEENIIKSKDIAKKNINKKKIESIHRSRPKKIEYKEENKDTTKKYLRERKTNQKEQTNKELESNNLIIQKCERCIELIKANPLSKLYYKTMNPNTPCIFDIEKNIKNNKYSSSYEFFMDLRKIWLYYYQNYSNNPEIYEKTSTMSKLSEDLCKDVDNLFGDNNHEFHNIKQKLNHFEKDLNDYKVNGGMINQSKNVNNMSNPMSIEEKNNLGNAIRNLNKEQLKGIIRLLSDSKINQHQTGQTKYFEFDIDKLPQKKLRELEKYVKDCEKETKNNINNNKEQNEQIRKLKHDLSNKNNPIENVDKNFQNNSEPKKSNLQNPKNNLSESSSSSDSDSDSFSSLNK